MCLEGFGAHMITHLEVRSDKAMSFEVLKITSHEQVEEKCGLQGRGREGGREEGGEERERGEKRVEEGEGGDDFLLPVRISKWQPHLPQSLWRAFLSYSTGEPELDKTR